MLKSTSIISSITVGQNLQISYAVGVETNDGRVVIEIKAVGSEFEDHVHSEYDVLDEDGQLIASIENMPCLVEWTTIVVDGPVGEVDNEQSID